MADGLEYLHTYDIVHGDVRGTNVLIDADWHVRLTDFGLAILSECTTPTNGAVAGLIPFAWAAPELVDETCKRPTFACDVFSFGRTCIEVCLLLNSVFVFTAYVKVQLNPMLP